VPVGDPWVLPPAALMPAALTHGRTERVQDCEGIDAYDQTGSYSVQLFSLAVLLSSLFVYNQVRYLPS
jgi:hypothetical protein